jgi:hypothetical protein
MFSNVGLLTRCEVRLGHDDLPILQNLAAQVGLTFSTTQQYLLPQEFVFRIHGLPI